MFILDSLFISGFRWVLDTVVTAAEAERNDDTALREELLAAEMRRELGEISDDEFVEIEADLLTRIREIKERREGGSGPIAFGGEPIETGGGLEVEATVAGDFHESSSGTVIEGSLVEPTKDTKAATITKHTKYAKHTKAAKRTARTARTSRTPSK